VHSFFEPNDELTALINLAKPDENYEVVHVRLGDLYAYDTTINFTLKYDVDDVKKKLCDQIKMITERSSNKILIMCDSDAAKEEISNVCNVYPTAAKSVHMNTVSRDDLKGTADTLVDFFLLRHAKAIHQFSVHGWGSTFSNAAHWLYGVPLSTHALIG